MLFAGAAEKRSELDPERYRANVVRSRRLIRSLARPVAAIPDPHSEVADVMFHPSGKTLIAHMRDKAVDALFDVESSKQIVLPESIGFVRSLTWSSDGRRLYAGGEGRVIALRFPELDQPAVIESDSQAIISNLKCDASDRFLAMVAGSHVQVWNIEQRRFCGQPISHDSNISGFDFSRDSQWLVTSDVSRVFHAYETKSLIKNEEVPEPAIPGD